MAHLPGCQRLICALASDSVKHTDPPINKPANVAGSISFKYGEFLMVESGQLVRLIRMRSGVDLIQHRLVKATAAILFGAALHG